MFSGTNDTPPQLLAAFLPGFQIAIRAVPHRHDFYNRLAEGSPHDAFDTELEKWLSGLASICHRMMTFLEPGGYGKV